MRVLAYFLLAALAVPVARAQVDAPILYLQRGMLWNSYYYAKTGAPFNNWRRSDIGMDWPGFDPAFVNADLGAPPSHLLTGGLWFTARDSQGKVIALDDFAMYASSTTTEPDAKYRVSEHRKVFGAEGNVWLQTDPGEAEELITSAWRVNPGWVPTFAGDRQHPIAVRREVRQWGGYQTDENYILVRYTLTNVSDTTLYDARAMLAYAFAMNARSQSILFPTLTDGARNTRFLYTPSQRLLVGWTIDYTETPGRDETYGFYPDFGPTGKGEYLAPAYVGLKLLEVTPNTLGRSDPVASYAWMPADPQQDQQGPFVNQNGFEAQYGVVADPRTALNATRSPSDPMWGRSRIWSLLSLGPWDLAPGDSVTVAWAEVIGGISYAQATNPGNGEGETSAATVGQTGFAAVRAHAERAEFAYAHGYDIPDAPPAPPVAVKLYDAQPGVIANVISWPDTYDTAADPDYTGAEAQDVAGYRLYRSGYLPIGPWEMVREVGVGEEKLYDAATGTYTVLDTSVAQGFSYYYALTAFDTGHESWPVDPSYRFPDTRSNRVAPLESSLYANRTPLAFKATIPAADDLGNILVVPNPFIANSGFLNPGDQDAIQFINLPSPATIRIYTLRGNLVRVIDHADASGIAFWNQETESGQFVESGVYVFHVETPDARTQVGKFAIIR